MRKVKFETVLLPMMITCINNSKKKKKKLFPQTPSQKPHTCKLSAVLIGWEPMLHVVYTVQYYYDASIMNLQSTVKYCMVFPSMTFGRSDFTEKKHSFYNMNMSCFADQNKHKGVYPQSDGGPAMAFDV